MLDISYRNLSDFYLNAQAVDYSSIVYAKDAVSGRDYFCVYCGCALRKKVSKKGNAFFATVHGEAHTKSCGPNKVTKKTIELPESPDFDIDVFLHGLSASLSERKNVIRRTYVSKNNGLNENNETKVVPAKNLNAFLKKKYERKSPDYVFNVTNKVKIKDILYSYYLIDELYANPNLLNSSIRYVEMKPHRVDEDRKKIICYMFKKKEKKKIYFEISFKNQKIFERSVKKVFKKEDSTYKAIYKSVFIGAEWVRKDSDYYDYRDNKRYPYFTGHIANVSKAICVHERYEC